MSTDPEKKHEACVEEAAEVSMKGDQEMLQAEARKSAERRLVRKLDLRLLPAVVVIYLMNYIDRVAIASARLKGLQADLGLSNVQYDTVVAVLYASYAPAQVPSNMVINHVSSPAFYIGGCVVLWGLASALTGITHSYAGILACRIFLGLPEAAFYPGVVYLLSRWYTRKELSFRTAILLGGYLISNAFGSFWAAGVLGNMNGSMGIAAWRWLFYIEGAITIFIGLLAMWLLPDHPHNTRWLSPAERQLAQIRLAEDTGEADKDSERASILEGLKSALKDPKVLIFMVMNICQYVGFSFVLFFPTLTATFGYSTTDTLLIAAPPWIFATFVMVINARHADITGERFFHQTAWWWAVMIGLIISLSTKKIAARYFSMFFMTSGNAAFALTLVWLSNTVPRPPAKRAAAIGLVNGFGNLGNVIGSYVWKSSWGPEYHQSMIIALCAFIAASIFSFVIRTMLVWENNRMENEEIDVAYGSERERVEEAARLEGITFGEAVKRRGGFRYLY